MDKTKDFDLALVEWVAKLKSRDRSRKSVRPNFEELFQKWKDLDASFDDLYETYLPKAIKAHQPLPSVARSTYKTLKSKMDKTEKEFIEEWNDSIEGTGQEVFFEFFPATTLDKDDEPKVFGNMSATEYRAQQRRTEQFKTLSTDELIKQWKSQSTYDLDVETTLENILGGSDETNS
jgi:hypothetical protein